jgi:hypothetical protein
VYAEALLHGTRRVANQREKLDKTDALLFKERANGMCFAATYANGGVNAR